MAMATTTKEADTTTTLPTPEEEAPPPSVDPQDIDDVIGFLSHDDVSIQLHALRLVQGLTVEQQVRIIIG